MVLLPSPVKIYLYNKFFGWEIHKTAKIGLSFLHAKKIKIGQGSIIGHFNVVRHLELLEIGDYATIGNFNWMRSIPLGSDKHFKNEIDRKSALILGNHSDIVSKHFFDCNNQIIIGEKTIIAGSGSSFYTHSISIERNCQESAPIYIGSYSMIGANSVITRGARLPDYCVLGANSTLHKNYEESYKIYSGVPAVAVKELSPDSKFFHREVGFVD